MSFSDVVENIKRLSFEEKQEIQVLLSQYLREERRDDIYDNYKKSLIEEQNNELNFSSNVDELKNLMEE
ncbi:MAG: hypothetical protein AB4372_13150 [Xenococcus sp. (in: cyanobacteria)]